MENFIEPIIKPLLSFVKKVFLRLKNRNKFFVEDYHQQEKEYYYPKKVGHNEYGVFHSKSNEPIRIYKEPEHNNPRKLARQYAKKLAMKQARGIR